MLLFYTFESTDEANHDGGSYTHEGTYTEGGSFKEEGSYKETGKWNKAGSTGKKFKNHILNIIFMKYIDPSRRKRWKRS